jgi:S1/P1 Nuclease
MKLPHPRRAPILLALAGFLWLSPPAWAWGCKGHQTVALLAEQHLTPEALELVNKLLAENPVDSGLKRYCTDPAHDLLADASTWPDDVRNSAKNGPWHYIDIPRGAPRAPLSEYCGAQGCVTKAIADQVAVLKNLNADAHLRADAIRYLVHLVADLHMPLHATSNDDRGGNCVPVKYFWRQPRAAHDSFTPNLHFIWDVAILELDMDSADPAEYAAFLSQTFAKDFSKWREAGIHLDDWAWESHEVAESVVYGRLSPPVPIEKAVEVHTCADDNSVGQRMMDLHLSAGESYQQAAVPVVRQRLAQAAVRLALILNDAAAD